MNENEIKESDSDGLTIEENDETADELESVDELKRKENEEKILETKNQIVDANNKRLDEFGNIIKGGKKLTEEERMKRIALFDMLRRGCKVLIILGMVVALFSSAWGSKIIVCGIFGTIACMTLSNVHMTAQMKEERDAQRIAKMRDAYGIDNPTPGNISADLFKASSRAVPGMAQSEIENENSINEKQKKKKVKKSN